MGCLKAWTPIAQASHFFSHPSCPVDWTQFSSSCYLTLDTTLQWQEGRDACEALGARLVEITSDEENQFIVDLVDDVTFTSVDKAWLDCTNIGRSLNDWICGADDHELSYDNWKSNEPNNFAQENCMEIYPNGVWNDQECNEGRVIICKRSLHQKYFNEERQFLASSLSS